MKTTVPAPLRSALVLVASSDNLRRAAIVRGAEQSGHRVLEAVDGLQAVTAATRYIPDLLIADAVLPQLDGTQVATTLKENPDTTDVVTILVGEIAAARDVADPSWAIVESTKDVANMMATLLSRRTTASDGIVTLRRALADVRASANDPAGDGDGATTLVRARQIANSVEELMISVLVADDDARYVEANAAACALSGYSREELLAMTIWDLTPEQRVPRDRRLWDRFKRDGRFEGSYRIRRRTGETVTIRCAASANVSPGLHVSALAPARLLEVIRS
jgi:PAS domain S-box-containing protein